MICFKSWLYLILTAAIINGLPLTVFCQEAIHEVKVSPSQVQAAPWTMGQPQLRNTNAADTTPKIQYATYARSLAPAMTTPVLISSHPNPVDSSEKIVNHVVVQGGAKAPAARVAPQPVEPALSKE